jgi:outer membrane protein TolC
MSQRIGMRDSNSLFFVPEQQGNSQLALSFNQPLLNGFGKPYNTALILLADIDASMAMDQTSAALQLHLTQIAESYWELYWQRAVLIQKHRNLQRAEEIWEHLVRRREVDALESQIVRARAAVATRQAELIRTGANIQNVEARLRALTNAPELRSGAETELIPLDYPRLVPVEVSLPDATVTALQHRPEIDAASEEIRAAGVRLNMSRKELLPALDLVLETYVTGLDRDYDIAQALVDQFSVGEPSYSAGLVFEVPLHRRAARARLQRRQLELRQITQQFEEVVLMLRAEVEVAVREVSATYRELVGRYRAMQAAEAEVQYLTRRWEVLSGDERSASFLLEDLLNAQDRLAVEEHAFASAQRDYTLSQILLKRATGTLLQYERIEPARICSGGQPELQFHRTAPIVTPAEVLPPISSASNPSAVRTTLR